jgi:AcrR family transcriptional regulator
MIAQAVVVEHGEHDHERSPGAMNAGERGPIKQVNRSVVHRLRAHSAEIEEAVFTRVSKDVPDPVSPTDKEYLNGLRSAVAASLDYMLTGIELGKSAVRTVPSATVMQARRAARAGIGLDTVIRRYVTGHALLADYVFREAEHADFTIEKAALRWLMDTSTSLLDDLLSPVTDAYRDEIARVMRARAGQTNSTITSNRNRSNNNGNGHSGIDNSHIVNGNNNGNGRAQTNPQTPSPAPKISTDARAQGKQSSQAGPTSDRGLTRASRAPYKYRAGAYDARILDATVEILAERGIANTTVGMVIAHSRVPRRVFYECRTGLDDCIKAVMDRGLQEVCALASEALDKEGSWQDGMREALAAVLLYLDDRPALARVLLVESMAASTDVLQHREQVISTFRLLVVAYIEHDVARTSSLPQASPLAAESTLASVMMLTYRHMATSQPKPLITMLGPLMGTIAERFGDDRATAEEVRRGDELRRMLQEGDLSLVPYRPTVDRNTSIEEGLIPPMLANQSAWRARQCLRYLSEHLGSSNRDIADGIGVPYPPQVSRMLSDFQTEGLVSRESEGTGKCNAWWLTPHGEQVVKALSDLYWLGEHEQ